MKQGLNIDTNSLDANWNDIPNLKLLPKWTNWIAMDESGIWHAFQIKPYTRNNVWEITNKGFSVDKCYSPSAVRLFKDWQDIIYYVNGIDYINVKNKSDTLRYIGDFELQDKPQFENYCPVCIHGPTHMKHCNHCGRDRYID